MVEVEAAPARRVQQAWLAAAMAPGGEAVEVTVEAVVVAGVAGAVGAAGAAAGASGAAPRDAPRVAHAPVAALEAGGSGGGGVAGGATRGAPPHRPASPRDARSAGAADDGAASCAASGAAAGAAAAAGGGDGRHCARCEEPTLVAAEFGGLCYYCHAFPGVPTWRQLSARFALVAAFRAAHGAAALSERRRGKEAYSEEPLPGFELAV